VTALGLLLAAVGGALVYGSLVRGWTLGSMLARVQQAVRGQGGGSA
jgi:hypothetical protein